jgi:hypothetical protein
VCTEKPVYLHDDGVGEWVVSERYGASARKGGAQSALARRTASGRANTILLDGDAATSAVFKGLQKRCCMCVSYVFTSQFASFTH